MLDFHSHILPRMDDGSASEEMTLQMLEMLQKQGVTAVAATPHFYAWQDKPEKFLNRRQECFSRLPENLPVKILPGAEVAYFDGMHHSESLPSLQIGQTGLLLVEMPFGKWSGRMVQQLQQIAANRGLTPVLAHAERYRRQLKQYLPALRDARILLQCNAEAFLHWKTRHWALKMVQKGYVDFLGTDAHNLTTRPPNYGQAAAYIEKKLGREVLTRLTKNTL